MSEVVVIATAEVPVAKSLTPVVLTRRVDEAMVRPRCSTSAEMINTCSRAAGSDLLRLWCVCVA